MSNIIWKEVNSNTLSGLIISQIPAITKPKVRTEIITIDGVDGDFVNELGYESYEKILKISLGYNYNINEIIKYFSGEGNLILPNEPDKYYKAKIIDKIDYDSLLRFKVAEVKYHCQPFKYKLNEESITGQNTIEIINYGLENSKPLITLEGTSGTTVSFYLNETQIFSYTFDSDEKVVIDSENQEAYFDGELKNRNMIGEFPILLPGTNEIVCNNSKITATANSRWL